MATSIETVPDFTRRAPREMPLVLVVDDDFHVVHAIAEALRDERFVVATAPQGKRALEMLEAGLRPHLLLVDVNMPIAGGAEVVEAVRAHPILARTPIVLISAFSDFVENALASQVQAVLAKPVNLSSLVDTVERHRIRTPAELALAR